METGNFWFPRPHVTKELELKSKISSIIRITVLFLQITTCAIQRMYHLSFGYKFSFCLSFIL